MQEDVERKLRKVSFNVRKYRKEKGKSQRQVARKLEISQNAYSKLETGKTQLTVIHLMIISDYLTINISDLLEGN